MAVDQIKRLCDSMPATFGAARRRFGRSLTLAEKILDARADDVTIRSSHPMTDEQIGQSRVGLR